MAHGDDRIKSMSRILRAFGINIPDSIFEQDTKYTHASQDINKIRARANNERRELTEEEQKEIQAKEKIMAATEKAHNIISMLPPNIQLFADGLIAGAIILNEINKLGEESIKNLTQMNDALISTGDASSQISKISELKYETSKNWEEVKRSFEAKFDGLNLVITEISNLLSKWYSFILDPQSKSSDDIHTDHYGWYTKRMESEGLTVNDMNRDISSFSTAFQNQGASVNTANNMAIMLHNAIVTSDIYKGLTGEAREQMMSSALNAAVGGDALSQFGINTSDNVLAGFLAGQGIDNINVRLSDSMESLYRIKLIYAQLGADSKEVMQKQISDWEKTGAEIEACKGKLLSFDKEIVLGAFDSTIPEMSMPSVMDPNGNIFGGTGEILNQTEENIERTKQKLIEYIDTLNLTPEEKETLLKLLDEKALMDIAAYLDECGMLPSDILTILRTIRENPDAVPSLMRELNATQEVIDGVTQRMMEFGLTTEGEIAHADSLWGQFFINLDKWLDGFGIDLDEIVSKIKEFFKLASGSIGLKGAFNFGSDLGHAFMGSMVGDTGYEPKTLLGNKIYDKFTDNFDRNNKIFGLDTVFNKDGNAEGGYTDIEQITSIAEKGRGELILPLESPKTVDLLADAMGKAGGSNTVYLTVDFSGTNILDSDDSMRVMAERIRDEVARLDLRDGGLR